MKRILFLISICMFLSGCNSKKYVVTFNTDGGNYLDSVYVLEGEIIELDTVPVKEGYLFVNWLKDGEEFEINSKIYDDIELTAKWILAPPLINDYTITYVTNSYEERIMVEDGAILEEPVAPEIDGYIFSGWYVDDYKYDFNTPVTSDIELIAKYKLDTVRVKFYMYDDIYIEKEIIRGTSVDIIDTPLRDGYKFLKWVILDKKFSFDMKIYEDTIIKAIWEEIEYVTVSFDTDGGNSIKDMSILKYSNIEDLPIPYKDGYKFLYWDIDGRKYDGSIIDCDIELRAIYEIDNCN